MKITDTFKCKFCVWYCDTIAVEDGIGACMFYPPVAFDGGPGKTIGTIPPTGPDRYCSKFEPRGE